MHNATENHACSIEKDIITTALIMLSTLLVIPVVILIMLGFIMVKIRKVNHPFLLTTALVFISTVSIIYFVSVSLLSYYLLRNDTTIGSLAHNLLNQGSLLKDDETACYNVEKYKALSEKMKEYLEYRYYHHSIQVNIDDLFSKEFLGITKNQSRTYCICRKNPMPVERYHG